MNKTFKPLSIAVISCLGILVYSNTFHCSFHLDDFNYIVDNPYLKNIHDLQGIWNFYPCRFLTFFTLALNEHFNGGHVFGYHLFNLMVHLVSAVLVWWLTLLTFSSPVMKPDKITRHARLIALLAGLVFVSHPIQTAAVTYIWQRAASMAAMFYLASLCCYVKFRLLQDNKGDGRLIYIFSLITAIAAMFTKEMTATLPFMILFYEFSFLKTKKSINWKYIIPFFLILIFVSFTVMLLPKSIKAQEMEGVISGAHYISPGHYLLTQFRVVVTYIRMVFFPFNQDLDYDYPISKSLFEFPVLISFLFLAGILFWAKHLFLKHRLVSFAIFWFFLTLLPESSAIPLKDVIFEHRLYLPLAGYSIFLASGAYYLWGKRSVITMVVLLGMVICCNAVLTYQRNKIWKDELTLWNDTISKSPHKARPYNNRGNVYLFQGNITKALSDYNKAIDLDPDFADAYNNLGFVYDKQGNFDQAISDYNRAIEIDPRFAGAYYNRGISYSQHGDLDRSLSDYNRAIELDPLYGALYNNRGNIYARKGDLSRALSDYNKAIAMDPNNRQAYLNRGILYDKQGNLNQAVFDLNKVIEIDPRYALGYSDLAILYYSLKEYDKAWDDVHKVEELGVNADPKLIGLLKQASGQEQ